VSYINAGDAVISGIDLTANWNVQLSDIGMNRIPGYFGVNFVLTHLLKLQTQATSTSPVVDWKGSLGPDPGTSLTNGAYDYRVFTTFTYGFSNWNFNLRWRHLPKADAAQTAAVGEATVFLGAQSSYNVFDLSGSWSFNGNSRLRFGIDNLFHKDPVITGGRIAPDPNPTTGQGVTEAGFYDILGRRFYVGMEARF
jgi:iron complex outermembrane recepter protein